jgi:tetratricopeptide (TPR) repeat protein
MAAAAAEPVSQQPLVLSAVTQAGLFFEYLRLWFWPDTGAMSIDLRVDFLATWSAGWIAAKVLAYAAFGAAGLALLLRGGAAAIAGFGMLYAWILFGVEFSAARFQEPLVLYRSYLWAPGYACIALALSCKLPRAPLVAAGALAGALLAWGAHDRLTTFSSPLRLWEDAAAKLPDAPVPWGSRTLYGAGREYLYAGMPDKAIASADRCIRIYPKTADCHYARGAIHLHLEQYELAARYLRSALALTPAEGVIHHRLGLALEGMKLVEEAKFHYREAARLGYRAGEFELQRLQTPGRGLLAPGARK